MSVLRKKMIRIQRLREMEQGKLNVLSAELAEIAAELLRQQELLNNLEREMNETSTGQPDSVDAQACAMAWANRIQSLITQLKTRIAETEQCKSKLQSQAVQQRAKVRGWEFMIDRLNAETMDQQQRSESQIADDRFLNDRKAR